MEFEWDAKKSSANEKKHGIDFQTARNIWLDENRIEIYAPHPVEDRRITIGKHQDKLWTAILPCEVIPFASFLYDMPEKRRQSYMANNKLAKNSAEFDRRFDSGEDIHDLIDMSKATVIHHGKKVRITLDVAESLVKDIDEIRQQIGVDRGALIKVWLHERIKQEKAVSRIRE